MRELLRNIKIILFLFVSTAILLIAGLVIQENRSKDVLMAAAGENKKALASRYENAGTIYSSDGVMLAHSAEEGRRYADDAETAASFLQLVGDYTHNIGNTIEAVYQGNLTGGDRSLAHQLQFDLAGKGLEGDDIILTLNAELNCQAYRLMREYDGAAVLINYKTGAVLAAVSTPSTSPDNVINYTDIPDTALFNRAFMGGYAPGSSYKYVTAGAWLTSTDYDPDLTVPCTGAAPLIEPDGVKENREDTHGTLNMTEALEVSCNHFFGEIGVRSGRGLMLEAARKNSVGKAFKADKLSVYKSRLSIPDRDSTLSWVSIGQPVADSELYISPLQMAMMVGSIGNDGVMMSPHIIDHMVSPLDTEYEKLNPVSLSEACTPEIAERLGELLEDAVSNGTGSPAAVDGLTVCGKTGTAEVEGQDKENAIFVGYVADEEHPYAVAVICENAGLGSAHAAPIAGELLRLASEIDRR
ncbi:MAG: penicillin-binding transpeptidase domain-containing protein [Fastidiosipilaceae bacterium]|jgi:peptidoglycan glycosyltransferase